MLALPEMGYVLLCLTTIINLQIMLLGLIYKTKFVNVQVKLAHLSFLLIVIAAGIMWWLLLNDQFFVKFVWNNSQADLPFWYKLSAMWGGHEGSMILWLLIMSAVFAGFNISSKQAKSNIWLIQVFFALQLFMFGLFTVATSNPFVTLLPVPPTQGLDLNPLLQDWAMSIHPPLLYLGYLATTIPFAVMFNNLYSEQKFAHVAVVKRWLVLSGATLTSGILLGSWWAYKELGWGGWWFWDPVENVSLLPWLVIIMATHSLIGKKDLAALGTDAKILLLTGYPLATVGAFIVRSGLLVSVHNFTSDSTRGVVLLGIFAVVMVLALSAWLYASSLQKTAAKPVKIKWQIFTNYVTITTLGVVIAIGTFFPILYELVFSQIMLVGAPFYNWIIPPLAAIMFMFLILASIPRKVQLDKPHLFKIILIYSLIGWGATFLLPTGWSAYAMLLTLLLPWGIILFYRLENKSKSIKTFPMVLAHSGMILLAIGSVWDGQFSQQDEVLLPFDQTIAVSGLKLQFLGEQSTPSGHYVAEHVSVAISKSDDDLEIILRPERRRYLTRNQIINEAAIHSSASGHIHLVLGLKTQQGWSVRITQKPLIQLVWFGAWLIALAFLWLLIHRGRQPNAI